MYGGNPEDIFMHNIDKEKRTGELMEEDLCVVFASVFEKLDNKYYNSKDFKDTRGTYEDKCNGTDFIFQGIRMDITLNFSNKNFMPGIYEYVKKDSYKDLPLKLGIRYANDYYNNGHRYKEFDDPVVVCGFDLDSKTYNLYRQHIEDFIEKNAVEIFDKISDIYCDFTAEMDDRENVAHLLHENKQAAPISVKDQLNNKNMTQTTRDRIKTMLKLDKINNTDTIEFQ